MSKRKKNYPDPAHIVQLYGADALRLYLINSPVVRGDNLRFREDGVKDILKDVLIPWYNAYRFLVQNVQIYEKEEGRGFAAGGAASGNVMDRWIVSYTNSLVAFVRREMDAYRLYTVVPRLLRYVDTLTNWYIRTNRRRLKGESGGAERLASLETLCHVLLMMVRVMAPFTPFLTDLMWRNLRWLLDPDSPLQQHQSVHYLMMPEVEEELIDKKVESQVQSMQTVVELARVVRDRRALPIKYPLKELVVIDRSEARLEELGGMRGYVLEELNVRTLTLSTDKARWGVRLKAEPDHKTLGLRLKRDFQPVLAQLKTLGDEELTGFVETGEIRVAGQVLSGDDLKIGYSLADERLHDKYEAHSDGQIIVLLDVSPDQTMLDEGLAREIVNRIQKLRKKAKLVPQDEVTVYCSATPADSDVARVLGEQRDYIEEAIRKPLNPKTRRPEGPPLIEESAEIKGARLQLTIFDTKRESVVNGPPRFEVGNTDGLAEVKVVFGARQAPILLEQPTPGENPITYSRLLREVSAVFDLWDYPNLKLGKDKAAKEVLHPQDDLMLLEGATLFVIT